MKKLAVIMAVVMLGAVAQSQATAWQFGNSPSSPWLTYVNVFDQSDVFQFGFPEATPSTASWNWAAGPANPLTGGPNTRLYDENVADPFWVDQITFEANLVSEVNYYQERFAADADTITFNFDVIANTLPAGYEAVGFIKVLDAFDSWATYQIETTDLSLGFAKLDLTVDQSLDPSLGTTDILIQAGYWIKGAYVSSASPEALTGVQIVPEPATIGLMGIAGLGMFVARRRLKI